MLASKPVIGIVGGVGSGKTFVAKIFGEMGCLPISSDELVASLWQREDVKQAVRSWWGQDVFDASGQVDKAAVARKVFHDPVERRRLERLVHPLEEKLRQEAMASAAGNPDVRAYVLDVPLLAEVGLASQCDAVVFVEAPPEIRRKRAAESRGWDDAEWQRRENSQIALDKKRRIAKYIVRNTAGADEVRSQVRELLPRILAGVSDGETPRQA